MPTRKITDEEILESQTKKAIAEGKLKEFCTENYGEEMSKAFCDSCVYREICEMQQEKKKKK